jgi:hypothetical protein
VPVGLDAVHWHVQVASHAEGNDLVRAVDAVRSAIAAALTELSGGAVDDVLTWYLTDRLARYEEAVAAGTLGVDDPRPGVCLRLLEELS